MSKVSDNNTPRTGEVTERARYNLKQLYSYIRALAERRFATVNDFEDYSFSLRLDKLPEHEFVLTPAFSENKDASEDDLILSVTKAEVAPCPALPKSLVGWLNSGWDDPSCKAVPMDKHETPTDDPENPEIELFTDDPVRRADYGVWLSLRDTWQKDALPAYNARKLYDRLYALYSELEREKDRLELMLGDGIFETTLEDGTKICHPLVIERATLVFNSNVPCFTVSDCDTSPSLFSRLLRGIPGLEWNCLSDFSEQLEHEQIHPYEIERFGQFLSSFSNAISSECEFLKPAAETEAQPEVVELDENGEPVLPAYETAEEEKPAAKYTIRRGAVLFTRPRAFGYSAILDKIIDNIDVAEEFSPSLLSIIGEGEPAQTDVTIRNGAMEVNGIDRDVLLEKAANREQLLIAKKLAVNSAVLVQGPPGTGKTHTISNIVGDLLARGMSVLISSQTSKALSVLRDKISEPIRPLCVSVLDDNRKQLEQSLSAINDYMSAHNADSLDQEAEELERERTSVIDRLSALRGELIRLVEAEYAPIASTEGEMSPKDAAMFIAALAEEAFIPDSVPLETELPLFEDELSRLYASNISVTADDETILASGAPDSSALLKPAAFGRVCSIVSQTDEELTSRGVDYWKNGVERDAGELKNITDDLRRLAADITSAAEWKLRLAQAGLGAAGKDSVFSRIGDAIPELRELANDLRADIIDSTPMIPENMVSAESQTIINEILEEVEGERIGTAMRTVLALTHPLKYSAWKQLLDSCLINGEIPDTRSELETLSRYHHLLYGRQQLIKRWQTAVESIGGPAIGGEEPEAQAAQGWSTVSTWLGWYENQWTPVAEKLRTLGFDLERYWESLPIESRMQGEIPAVQCALTTGGLAEIIEDEFFRGDRSECLDRLASDSRALLPYTQDIELLRGLRECIERRDAENYGTFYDCYDRICLKRETYLNRLELIARLKAVCPKWAELIAQREGVNGAGEIPGDISRHWLRAQLSGELNRRCGTRVSEVQSQIEKLNSQLSGLTRELISRKAWSAQLRTMMDGRKKQALANWATLVKRVGKGTGKRAEQLLASGELRRAMKECRRAVPVWIMPMSSVAEYFDPADEKFDVLIIDEASQADLTALVSLYLAKKVIVVGDDRQVSPSPIGVDVETSAKLRQEFLSDIPAATMYDELTSVYDLAKANYEPITLREHFRCADDIINFSNYYTYDGLICPLRDSASIKLHPSTVSYHVDAAAPAKRKTNRSEAVATAALIKACIEQPEYKKSTFGVITMLGDEQALMIDRILRDKLTEYMYQSRQILCGNPSYFQGDERDVIFISLVDTPKGDGTALSVRREGYNELYAKRYNVAASRARDQLWVVHSLNPGTDLKGDDIRLSLIRHAEDPASTAAALEKKHPAVLSDMEEAVSAELTRAGYRVVSRQKVGSYIVGLTCEGKGGRVAIECDGDVATDAQTIVTELNKQSVLERLGWRFIRLRASEYYRDPAGFLASLAGTVEALGLEPGAEKKSADSSELLDRVRARAAELIAEWSLPAAAGDDGDSAQGDDETPESDSNIEAAEADDAENADIEAVDDAELKDTSAVKVKPVRVDTGSTN